jgi:hypothetical protein
MTINEQPIQVFATSGTEFTALDLSRSIVEKSALDELSVDFDLVDGFT